ncbi:methyl-accepting chemotaxis protein [Methylobacterium sp. J-072]|uniref:methyl-accepting chemotaxis protein n=1 Tax=Methylobacterium sp. J-072 TaxID=2836651 RepID=UPI001FBA516A|nr:HAMP domain-containing methyl-accepting chemotaxis protein [Methylobacterium sp. J-072]MCJ2091256.1 methyl-accepting chemotaxis protein [Methylobacterium sp. J-072]
MSDAALRDATAVTSALPAQWKVQASDAVADATRLLAAARRRVDALTGQPLAQRRPDEVAGVVDALIAVPPTLDSALNAVDEMAVTADSRLGSWLTMTRTATELRDVAGQIGSVFTPALVGKRAMTIGEIGQYNRLSGQVDAQIRQMLLARGKIGEDARVDEFLRTLQAKYVEGGRRLAAGIVEQSLAGRPSDLSVQDFGGQYVPAMRSIIELRERLFDLVSDQIERRIEAARIRLYVYLLCGLAVIATCAGVIVLCIRKVSLPIRRMAQVMSRISDGDTEIRVPDTETKNEIGAMAAAVQVFKDNLIRTRALEAEAAEARAAAEEQRKAGMRQMAEAFEHAVGGIIGMVSSSATELQATAGAMSAMAGQTSAQSGAAASAADEAASNVNTVAAAAEELGSSVQEIGRQVDDSAKLANNAVDEAGQTAGFVQALSEAAGRIGDVVRLISDIAGQTNLLALNATIEAARAGEAGRGFAVVASEVKALAEQTARATEEIGQQIGQIQGVTGQAVSAIGAITARIQEISGVATSIAEAVEEQGAATQEIARNVAQAAQGTGTVTNNIAGVAGAAEETGAAATQVLDAATELSRQSEHLTAEVARFLHTVRAA